MQLLLKSSDQAPDLRCEVCGEGFAFFCERRTDDDLATAIETARQTIHSHHHGPASNHAHPRNGFLVPSWNGPIEFSGAALLGNAPIWALS